jgi:hypothetical protein
MSNYRKVFLMILLWAPWVHADDTNFKVGLAQVQVGTSSTSSKGSAVYDSDGDNFNGWLAGLTGNIPFGGGNTTASKVAEVPSNWRLGLTLGKEFAFDSDKMRIQLEPEWGFSYFSYYPDAVTQKSKTKYSYALGSNWFYYREPDESAPMAFQVKGWFSKDWTASPSVGLVSPATSTLPPTVIGSAVVSAPVELVSLTTRAYFWRQLSMGSTWALGPSVALLFTGPNLKSLDGTFLMRWELWVYRFIPEVAVVNLRIGFAPYLDKYFDGVSSDNRTLVPGVLAQVRAGDSIFTY